MICAIVSAENAALYQGMRSGVNKVMFMELIDSTWAAPIEMVQIIPAAFPDYQTRDVTDSEFKIVMKTRQQLVDEITAYLNGQLTDAEFKTFLADARNHLIDYTFGSDSLYFWIASTNGGTWGNFVTTGFKTKAYGSVERSNYIIGILS